MKKVLFIITIVFLFNSCSKNKGEFTEVIKVDNATFKKCYFFKNKNSDTLKFVRNIQILENTLNDTILLGNAILYPKYLGEFEYTQLEDKDDIILDLRYRNPPGDRICINSYKEKKSEGVLKIRLKIPD